jgi:hypothetical protein
MKYSACLLSALSLILAGCATSGSGAPATSEMNRVAAQVVSKYPGKQVLITAIEPAQNYLSNKMALAAIKLGAETNDSQAIKNLLANRKIEQVIVVTGVDDGLSAAILERALLDGKGHIQGGRVVFVGSGEYTEGLRQAADEAGVHIDFFH